MTFENIIITILAYEFIGMALTPIYFSNENVSLKYLLLFGPGCIFSVITFFALPIGLIVIGFGIHSIMALFFGFYMIFSSVMILDYETKSYSDPDNENNKKYKDDKTFFEL